MEEKERYEYLVQIILFCLALLLFILLLRPVFIILLMAILLSYLSFPIYKKLKRSMKWHLPAAITTILLIILVVSLPFSLMLIQVAQQATSFYQDLNQGINEGTALGLSCGAEGLICTIINNIDTSLAQTFQDIGLDVYLQRGIEQLITISARYLISIPAAIIGLGFSLIIVYYLLKDWRGITEKVCSWLPLKKKTTDALINQFQTVTHTVVFGQILVAIAQGVVSGIGYFIFGVPYPVFWGAVTAFAALIPSVGAAIIWLPAAILLFLAGYLTGDTTIIIQSLALLAYGIIVISSVDNILRIKISEKKAKMHPIVTLIGIIGGIPLFGVLGVFFGPIILALLITYFDNFKEKYN